MKLRLVSRKPMNRHTFYKLALRASNTMLEMVSALKPESATEDSKWYQALTIAKELKAEAIRRLGYVRDTEIGNSEYDDSNSA